MVILKSGRGGEYLGGYVELNQKVGRRGRSTIAKGGGEGGEDSNLKAILNSTGKQRGREGPELN